MATTMLICTNCGNSFQKNNGEYNRQLKRGRTNFFCSCKCAAKWANKSRKKPNIMKICPVCNKAFIATTKAKSATFCSRSCASKGSVNDARREAGRKSAADHPIKSDIDSISNILKRREAWKYEKLTSFLDFIDEKYEFERIIGHYVYDLVLIDRKMIFEFDGPNHKYLDTDKDKTDNALQRGYILYRISVKPNTVIDPTVLYKFLK